MDSALPAGWLLEGLDADTCHLLHGDEVVAVVRKKYNAWTARLADPYDHLWAWEAPEQDDVVRRAIDHILNGERALMGMPDEVEMRRNDG